MDKVPLFQDLFKYYKLKRRFQKKEKRENYFLRFRINMIIDVIRIVLNVKNNPPIITSPSSIISYHHKTVALVLKVVVLTMKNNGA